MAIWYADIECELREVVLKDKPRAMLDASVKATVPVLVLTDLVIDESIDVMHWVLTRSDPDGWLVSSLDHPLVISNDGYFKYYLDRYKYFDRYPDHSQAYYFEKACIFISELEAVLSNEGGESQWLNGPLLGAIDVAIFPFVRQFAFVDKTAFDALPYLKVQKWLSVLLESNLFKAVMLKYPAWQPQQIPVLFGQRVSEETLA